MAKITSASQIRKNSDAYTELFNDANLQVYALKGGRFEVVCGSTHAIAHSLQEVANKVDTLELHQCALAGHEVISAISQKLGKQFRLEIQALKKYGDAQEMEKLHVVEGSKDFLIDHFKGSLPIDIACMTPGERQVLPDNMFGGDFAVLLPLNTIGLPELSPSLTPNQMWEPQPLSKGDLIEGIDPTTGDVVKVLVSDAYPNGTLRDSNGKVYSGDEVALFQFCKLQDAPTPAYAEPDVSLYESSNIPSYNPTGEVEKVAPMIGNLANYDTILDASGSIISELTKKAGKKVLIDRCSLNKIKVSGIDAKGQATDGELEWSVKIGSPYYKRSSYVTIPMIMEKGDLVLGKYFVASTGQKFPLTIEALDAHLGHLSDDPFQMTIKAAVPSTLKMDPDVEVICAAIATKKTAEGGESWSDVMAQQEAIEASQTQEEAVQKLKDMGYVSTFMQTGDKEPETIEECVARVWDLYKDPGNMEVMGAKTAVHPTGEATQEATTYPSEDYVIFDNGGETLDRYTIVGLQTGSMVGASESPSSPQGFGMYVGDADKMGEDTPTIESYIAYMREKQGTPEGIGKEISKEELPEEVRRFADERFGEHDEDGLAVPSSKKTAELDPKKVIDELGDKPLDKIPGGEGDGKSVQDVDQNQLEKGIRIEMEHTNDPEIAAEISVDHQSEGPDFDKKYNDMLLKKVEKPLEEGSKTGAKKTARNNSLEHAQSFKVGDIVNNEFGTPSIIYEIRTTQSVFEDEEDYESSREMHFSDSDATWEANAPWTAMVLAYNPKSVDFNDPEDYAVGSEAFVSDLEHIDAKPEEKAWLQKALERAKKVYGKSAAKMAAKSTQELDQLWEKLGNVPTDNDGNIQEAFLDFPAGSKLENVWHWFEEQNPDFQVHQKLYTESAKKFGMELDAEENPITEGVEETWAEVVDKVDGSYDYDSMSIKQDDIGGAGTKQFEDMIQKAATFAEGSSKAKREGLEGQYGDKAEGFDNSYNWSYLGPTFWLGLEQGKSGKWYGLLSVHQGGDVRGNYGNTYFFALKDADKDAAKEEFMYVWMELTRMYPAITISFLDGSSVVFMGEQDSDIPCYNAEEAQVNGDEGSYAARFKEVAKTMNNGSDLDSFIADVASNDDPVSKVSQEYVMKQREDAGQQVLPGLEREKGAAKTADWSQIKDAIMSSETKEEAIKKLNESGYKSEDESNEAVIERLWDNYRDVYDPQKPENRANAIIDRKIQELIKSVPKDIKGNPDFYEGEDGKSWVNLEEIPEEEKDTVRRVYILSTLSTGDGFEHFKDELESAIREEIPEAELSEDDMQELLNDWDTDLASALPTNLGVSHNEGFGDIQLVLYKEGAEPTQEEIMKEKEDEGQQVLPGLERSES